MLSVRNLYGGPEVTHARLDAKQENPTRTRKQKTYMKCFLFCIMFLESCLVFLFVQCCCASHIRASIYLLYYCMLNLDVPN